LRQLMVFFQMRWEKPLKKKKLIETTKKKKKKKNPNRTSTTIENYVLISNWFHLTHNLTWQNSDTKGV